ncbi:MAG: SDR family oxidoreductase [Saccharofermentanales bacterium]
MKNVVITGSTRGIGLAMAKEFLAKGCNVAVSGRKSDIPDESRASLGMYKENYIYVQCDVKSRSDIERLWDAAAGKWGRIDIWINNAGVNCPYEFLWDIDQRYIDAIIDTNVKGVVFGSQIASRKMREQGSGQIWNMEGLGSNNMIQAKTIIYGTTKHALTYFTKALAKELKDSPVRAGRLSPGMMLTDFITKTSDGNESPVIKDKNFKFIFNILADRPETVAAFFVPRMLKNEKNDAQIKWLTTFKSFRRFMSAPFNKNRLI